MPINPNLPIERPPLTRGGRDAQEVIRTVRQLSQQRASAEPKDTAPGVRPAVVFGQTVPGELPPAPTLATPVPKPPAVSIDVPPAKVGGPISINLPGSSIELPIEMGPFGLPRLILPRFPSPKGKKTKSRGVRTTALKDIPGFEKACRELGLTRLQCILNLGANLALQIATRMRVPFGTVTFFPGKFPLKPALRPAQPVKPSPVPPVFVPGVSPPQTPGVPPSPLSPPVPGVIPPEIAPGPSVAPQVLPPSPIPAAPAPSVLPENPLISPQIRPRTTISPRAIPRPTPQVGRISLPRTGLARQILPLIGVSSLVAASLRSARPALARAASLAELVATSSPIGQVNPLIDAFPSPATQPFAQRARPGTRECQEVKRKRRRKGKCKEGYFEELPGKTRFTTWREVDCATGKTLKEFD